MPENPKYWKDDLSLDAMFLRVINGLRAVVTQPYDELNKKAGDQWEASTRVQLAPAPGGVLYTIFKTGGKPIDLKQRVLGFDGIGVVGRIYRNPTYTGGTPAPFWNMRTSKALVQPEAQILTSPTVTDRGVEIATPIYAFGPTGQQSRGSIPLPYASNRIFDELNTEYLLVIESLDPQDQYVSSRLELYEGGLDLPNQDYA